MATLSKGITLLPDSRLKKATNSTLISYYDNDYERTLRSALVGINSREDFLSQLQEVWIPLGSATISSVDEYYPIKNFTKDFSTHYLQIYGLTLSTNNRLVGYSMSNDNGISWNTTFCYAFNRTQTAGTFAPSALAGTNSTLFQWSINPSPVTGTSHEYVLDILLHNAANPDLLTHCFTYGWYMETQGTPGTPIFTEGAFSAKQLEANNAFALTLPSDGTVFTGGKIDVWGLEY